jgi:hypothetical protein
MDTGAGEGGSRGDDGAFRCAASRDETTTQTRFFYSYDALLLLA